MKEILTEVIYGSLTSIVPSTVAIMVPLVGAFWIFKVREKTVAEGKIFELGREIANIIQSKEIRGPIDGISYVYIDKAQHKIDEKNRERAINVILREYLLFPKLGEEPTEEEEIEAANIVVAVATERLQSLVPSTVNWTGKGSIYSPYGEEIETKDNYFPFGTKLYRQWIEKFSDTYNDLWAITNSRRFFLGNYLKQYKDSTIGNNEEYVGKWLDEIDERIRKIHPIHAKLLTQVQIIDTQVDLPRLGKDVAFLAFYGSLLSLAGYFVPRLIYLADLSSLGGAIWLSLATFLAYSLIGIRAIAAVQPIKEKNVQRTIFLPRLANELKSMEKKCMRYKPHAINNILSLDSDLKLPSTLNRTLLSLVDKIEQFNDYASILYKDSEDLIEPIKTDFATTGENQQGFSIELLNLASDDYDLEQIKSRIMKEEYNFYFSYVEMQSSRDIFTINLSELNREKRLDLCGRLDSLRESLQGLSSYRSSMLALRELQEFRSTAQGLVEKTYNKSSKKDALTRASS
ncbi:MAG: hypothetical protein JAZ13_19995 [Candidatus Thiodiazotropha taylori]|nr:hypothetical protein [Candidatus Thiodiazotropha taylori]